MHLSRALFRRSVKNRRGFVLPLSVILVLVLSISGMGFLQLDFQERRMAMNTGDNLGAFYLANAGIERARETFKIPEPDFSWTSLLQDPSPAVRDSAPTCLSVDPNSCLCPPDLSRGCVIAPFQTPTGAPIVAPDVLLFSGTFDNGSYTVRAFNNEPSTTDNDQLLFFRALGTIRGEQKLLEATIQAVSNLDLINCGGPTGSACPDSSSGSPDIEPLDGRQPAAHPTLNLLQPNPPLTSAANYYRDPNNFGLTLCSGCPLHNGTTLTSLDPNTYYLIDGDVTIQGTGAVDNVVVFSEGDAIIKTGVTLTNAVIIAVDTVELHGGVELHAPLPHPVIISGQVTQQGSGSVKLFGTVYSSGQVNLGPVSVEGVVIGNPVDIQGGGLNGCQVPGGTCYTDGGNLIYYEFMPGFDYPEELKTTVIVGGSWREIE